MPAHVAIIDVARTGAVLSAGIVHGTDAFFSIAGGQALARTSDGCLTEVMGRIHETADRRMPLVGAAALLMSVGCAIFAETTRGKMSGVAAVLLQVAYIALYTRYAKPINVLLIAGARAGKAAADTHALQRRWDRVVGVRFVLMGATMLCLTFIVR